MLTAEQVSFFRGFGFLVVDDLVEREVLDRLAVEVTSALDEAFGGSPEEQLSRYLSERGGPRPGAVLGQYLPIMSSSTPTSLAVAESDALIGAAQQILGTSTPIAKPAKAVRYVSPSGWHRDCRSRLPGAVKVIYYLESQGGITFELVPASHRAVIQPAVTHVLGARGDQVAPTEPVRDLPTVTVHLDRHQALVFDVGLWHRNPSASQRTQWSITYIADPKDADDLHDVVSFIGSFFGKHPGYDRDRFPFFPADWLDGSSDSALARHLNQTGAMKHLVERFGTHL